MWVWERWYESMVELWRCLRKEIIERFYFPRGGRCGGPEPRRKDKVGGRIDVWIQRDFCSLATANRSGGLCLLSSLGNEKGIILCVGESWQACSLERMDKIIDNIVKSLGEWKVGSWAALRAWSHGSRTCLEWSSVPPVCSGPLSYIERILKILVDIFEWYLRTF